MFKGNSERWNIIYYREIVDFIGNLRGYYHLIDNKGILK